MIINGIIAAISITTVVAWVVALTTAAHESH